MDFLKDNLRLGRTNHNINLINGKTDDSMKRCFAFKHDGQDIILDFNLNRGYGSGLVDEPLYTSAETYEA